MYSVGTITGTIKIEILTVNCIMLQLKSKGTVLSLTPNWTYNTCMHAYQYWICCGIHYICTYTRYTVQSNSLCTFNHNFIFMPIPHTQNHISNTLPSIDYALTSDKKKYMYLSSISFLSFISSCNLLVN